MVAVRPPPHSGTARSIISVAVGPSLNHCYCRESRILWWSGSGLRPKLVGDAASAQPSIFSVASQPPFSWWSHHGSEATKVFHSWPYAGGHMLCPPVDLHSQFLNRKECMTWFIPSHAETCTSCPTAVLFKAHYKPF